MELPHPHHGIGARQMDKMANRAVRRKFSWNNHYFDWHSIAHSIKSLAGRRGSRKLSKNEAWAYISVPRDRPFGQLESAIIYWYHIWLESCDGMKLLPIHSKIEGNVI
jgi:hypothetical protein